MQNWIEKLPTVGRIVLGLVFVLSGANGLFGFMPEPSMPAAAGAFMGALAATGYFFPLLKVTEIVAGLLLLSGRFVPLALAILAPIVVNIVAFHAVLAPSGLGIAMLVLALELSLAWSFRDSFASMIRPRTTPRRREASTVDAATPARA